MKDICFINGSPRGREASSFVLLKELGNKFNDKEYNKHFINVKNSESIKEDFEKMMKSDAIVFAFPLYIYCLPGVLMRFLERYNSYLEEKGTERKPSKVYAIVNCGFPEPSINDTAISVIKNFCKRLNLEWRFAALTGMGELVKVGPSSVKNKIFNALEEVAKDVSTGTKEIKENVYVTPKFPKKLFYFIGTIGWKQRAKANGLSKKDLYNRPYA
jgi:Multimeric flavodoxin WrbA